jgi:hypothetical protein
LQDTLVSHSLPQASEPVKTIHDTSGLGSQMAFDFFGQDSACLKMSKDTSASDSAKSSENWKALVIKRRGEYSARVKSARLTSASGSSSWPSPIASEVRQGFQDLSRGMKGSQESLTTVVVKEAAWPSPSSRDYKGAPASRCTAEGYNARLDEAVILHGQAAPASSNTLGSRQELSEENWITPQSGDVTGSTQAAVDMWAQGQRPKTSDQRLRTQVAAMERRQELWPTTTSHTPDMESNGPNGHSGTYLAGAAKAEEQKEWRTPTVAEEKNQNTSKQIYLQNQVGATPNNFCFQPPENTEQWTKRAEYQQTEKGVNLHKPIQSQVLHENEKVMGAMPPSSAKLNPRWVETLMGLPVGWVMPSCASPVTIALTSCASSAMESCQQQQSEHSELSGRNSQNE